MAIRPYVDKGKRYFEVYVNGYDSAGVRVQRRKRGLDSLRKAEAAEFEFKRGLANLKEQAAPIKWSDWFAECLRRMRLTYRPSTVANYEKQLGKWMNSRWGHLDLKQISKQIVYDTIFTDIDQRLSPWAKKSILKMARRIFEMAVEEGHLDRNPCAGVSVRVPEAEQQVLTNQEVEIFLREAKATQHRFYPIWALALMTGMRSGELFALNWTDIDFDGRTIAVTKQWTSKNGYGPTKTQRSRVVPVSDGLLKFLMELKMASGRREAVLPLFPEWERGEQAKITREFCVAIGVTEVKFHDLRATFITNLLSRGESLARVMAMVGHSQIKTTNGYLRRAGVDVQGATEKLGYELPGDVVGGKLVPFAGGRGPK